MMFVAGLLAKFGLADAMAKKLAPFAAVAAAIAFLGLLAWLAVSITDRWHENTITTATNAGVTGAVVAGQTQTLDQLGDANNAEETIRRAPERDARLYADCLLDARPGTEAGCERHNLAPRPDELVSGR